MIDWISVEDRLPEEGQEIIFMLRSGRVSKLLFCKQNLDEFNLIATHWYPYNPPVKRRWCPKMREKFFQITDCGDIFSPIYTGTSVQKLEQAFLGYYKTESEALAMRDKIRQFVTKEIGSV